MTPSLDIELGAVKVVPKSILNVWDLPNLQEELTFRAHFTKDYGFGKKEPVCLLREHDDCIWLPRHFDTSRWPVSVRDATVAGSPVSLGFRLDRQARQPSKQRFQDGLIQSYLEAIGQQPPNRQGGLICAPCGSGKTVLALKLADTIGRTLLVVVHKTFLVNQWRRLIQEYTSVKDDEVGIVRQAKCEWEGKKIVIALIQSLCSREYPDDFYRWAGHVMIDEVHRLPGPRWCDASMLFPAALRTGLTATPKRKDGMHKALDLTIGPILAQGVSYGVMPKVFQTKGRVHISARAYRPYERQPDGSRALSETRMYLARFLSLLIRQDNRNSWLVGEMLKACQERRKIFILSDRREHLDVLKGGFDASCRGQFSSGFYIGGMKAAELEESEKADAIFGTYAMASEALDIPAMDTLFLTTPRTAVEQAVGRILRDHDGKRTPSVVDVVDDVPFCLTWAKKRLKEYRRLGYTVCKSVDDKEGVTSGSR